jgi:lambda family phage minor tail protein L
MSTYYVRTDGSNSSVGTSDATAWATLAYAEAHVSSGDTVLLKRGNVWAADINAVSGVTYNAYGTGIRPIIAKLGFWSAPSNITISNIEITAGGGAGISFEAGSNITIDSCTVNGNNYGGDNICFVRGNVGNGWATNITVSNCEFKNALTYCLISVEKYAHNILIENCIFHGAGDCCIMLYNSDAGRNTAYAPHDVIVRGNECYGATNHGIEVGWDANLCTIERNYFHNNLTTGIAFMQSYNNTAKNNLLVNNPNQIIVAQAGSKDNKLYNNTCVAGATTVKGIWFRDTAETGNIMKNNLVYGIDGDFPDCVIETVQVVTSDYNCFFNAEAVNLQYGATRYTTLATWQAITSQDSHSNLNNPRLDTTYKLSPSSSCISTGVTIAGVTDDYSGLSRISGAYDIGAYKYTYITTTEKNKATNKPIFLYTIELYDGVNSLHLAEYDADVVFNSVTYTRFPIKHDFISENTQGEISSIKVTVANVSRLIQAYLENYDWRGLKVTIRMVWANQLTDPDAYIDHIFYIDSYSADQNAVEFTLSEKYNVLGLQLPSRVYSRNYCCWKFKSTECGYVGGQNVCNKTFQKCREWANQERFGGFPSIPSNRIWVS